MSTAILHAGSFIHDFNDIVMKVSFRQSFFSRIFLWVCCAEKQYKDRPTIDRANVVNT